LSDEDFEIGLRFAEQVTGLTPTDDPPPAGSPLANLLAIEKVRPVTEADVRACRDA
jgi:hypothetical protein